MSLSINWDAEYANGTQHGARDSEADYRYPVIAHLADQKGSLLDVGCGRGLFKQFWWGGTYSGLDISDKALLSGLGIIGGVCADFETWTPPGKYGTVLLNEVLYYFRDPEAALEKAWSIATCSLIISIYLKPGWRTPNKRVLRLARNWFALHQIPIARDIIVESRNHGRAWNIIAVEKGANG